MTPALTTPAPTWTADIAATMLQAYRGTIPDSALERTALQLFDAFACASGAVDAEPVLAARRAVAGSGPQVARVWFTDERVSIPDAVLVNGSALRYLDFNDSFIGAGPSGHPSDNVPVALAVAEAEGRSGSDLLRALTLGYEMYWRMRQHVYAPSELARGWDGTSASGVIAAMMAGLLMELDERRLTEAMAIGAAKGYGLKQLRRGAISSLKAAGNAMVAREGVLGALLAREGVTGPAEVFEGKSGMLAAFGLDATDELRGLLSSAPDWRVENSTIKLYPSIGTSQAALYGAIEIVRRDKPDPDSIVAVTVHLPESPGTFEHLDIVERRHPDNRETADHSLPFLLACAFEDGALSHAQFEDERWFRASTIALMDKVSFVPDEELARQARNCYPARVLVTLTDGTVLEELVSPTPGSPDRPLTADEVADKFTAIQRTGHSADEVAAIQREIAGLGHAPDLGALLSALVPTAPNGVTPS